jgi:hypothetical protein
MFDVLNPASLCICHGHAKTGQASRRRSGSTESPHGVQSSPVCLKSPLFPLPICLSTPALDLLPWRMLQYCFLRAQSQESEATNPRFRRPAGIGERRRILSAGSQTWSTHGFVGQPLKLLVPGLPKQIRVAASIWTMHGPPTWPAACMNGLVFRSEFVNRILSAAWSLCRHQCTNLPWTGIGYCFLGNKMQTVAKVKGK